MTKAIHPRINCCVPFCRRGTKNWPSGEVICGKCWRRVRRDTKRRQKLIWREIDKLQVIYDKACAGNGQWTLKHSARWTKLERMNKVVWDQAKKQAFEGGAGI